MRRALRIGVAVVLLLGAAGAWVVWKAGRRPDLSRWIERHELVPGDCPADRRCVRVTWMGVSTLAIDDGTTHLLIDGFFTRVPIADVLLGRPVAPDPVAIEDGLARAGIDRLDAVMTVHSHYDHAMDAGEVARRTGARLLGSRSTAFVGRGAGLPEEQIVEVETGVPYAFGDFRVTFHPSRHVPLPAGQGAIGESLDAPLVPPAPIGAWVEGGSYTIEIAHPLGRLLVQGSAGWAEPGLDGVSADVVLLGIGRLGSVSEDYRDRYWSELVEKVGARLVIPIHWDDFTLPPGVVEPIPELLDDVPAALEDLSRRAEADPDLALALLPPWQPVAILVERAPGT